jgi:sugar/nucleoside kinase (ribokinase family)
MKKILCFGDCNLDILIPIKELPVKGGCSFSSSVIINHGGGGGNVAVALHKLGFNITIISKLGKDIFGDFIKKYFEDMGINTKYLYFSDYSTGLTVGLISPDGEKRWIAVRGDAADLHIKEKEINEIELLNFLYISGVVVAEGKESRETAIKLAKRVFENGGKVFLDPNLRLPEWKISKEIKDAFECIFKYVNVFIPNQKELQLLGEDEDMKKSASNILRKGVQVIWVKKGNQGCSYFTKEKHFQLPAHEIEVIDTSGAGDAFDAAIIYGALSDFAPEKCGEFAISFAETTVQKIGTTKALPNSIEINKLINIFKDKKYEG